MGRRRGLKDRVDEGFLGVVYVCIIQRRAETDSCSSYRVSVSGTLYDIVPRIMYVGQRSFVNFYPRKAADGPTFGSQIHVALLSS